MCCLKKVIKAEKCWFCYFIISRENKLSPKSSNCPSKRNLLNLEGYCLKHVPWARRKKAFERVGRKRLSASEGQGLDKCLITTRAWWVVSTSWEGPWRLTPPSYSHPRGRDRSHPRDREQSQPMGRERSNYTSSEGGLEVNTSFKFS